MGIKGILQKVKERFWTSTMDVAEAKILAMLSVIYSDDKNDIEREIGLLKALCSFDARLIDINLENQIEEFKQYGGNLDHLFNNLAEAILGRDDRIDLLSSAYLLASIDGHISKEETQLLHRLANTLRMTLEEINTVREHSQYIADTLNANHIAEEGSTDSSEVSLPLNEAKVLAMLSVIRSDHKTATNREMGLLTALCSFDKRLIAVDLKTAQEHFERYQNNLDALFLLLSETVLERSGRLELLSSAFLLARIDGQISYAEQQVLDRLAKALHMTSEDIESIESHSQTLVDTMKELRVLA